tara:strand:+ start:1850 stop:2344 length:495 start_codon:yes stop_codon:yes gene_type:complete
MTVTINGNGTITPTSAVNPTGSVLQVLQNVKLDTASTNSTSFVDTGLSQAITPSSSSNKILCTANIYTSSPTHVIFFNLVRGSTNIFQPSGSATNSASTILWVNSNFLIRHTTQFLDSPNTTSATTYKVQYAIDNSSYSVFINRNSGSDDYYGTSSLTLMEIAG